AFGARLGGRWSFGLNVVSYLVMLAALAQMRMPPRPHAPSEHDWRRELVAGAHYAFGFYPARCALLLLAAVSITVGSYVALMPWFAREAVHGDSGTLGILIGAAGLGVVAGVLYLPMRAGVRGLFRLLAGVGAAAGSAR